MTTEGQEMIVRPQHQIERWLRQNFKIKNSRNMRQLPLYDRTRIWSLTRRCSSIPIELSSPIVEKSAPKTPIVKKVNKKVRFEDEVVEKTISMPQQ